ncbi:MAG: hypothetical protein ACREV7_04045 [Steroidobacteraceae bacterium]
MPSLRASAIALCATAIGAIAALAGCASSRLSSEVPPGERLAGDWKLDVPGSDDLGKAIEQLRVQIAKSHRSKHGAQQQQQQQGIGTYGGRRRGGGGGSGGQEGGQSDQGESLPGGGGQEFGPTPRVSPVDELMSNVPQGDYLRITVSASAFTVTSGDSSSPYTPGLLSEISAEQGDAQQISGWKDAAYVIDTTPQWGPEIIQSFDLTKDGRLAMVVRLSGHGIHYTFTRLYDRTTRVAPLAPPTVN